MSLTVGEKIFAAPHVTAHELVNAHVERIGPVAFLWRSHGHYPVRSRLVLLTDEGVEWCRDDEESRDALLAARKLFLSAGFVDAAGEGTRLVNALVRRR